MFSFFAMPLKLFGCSADSALRVSGFLAGAAGFTCDVGACARTGCCATALTVTPRASSDAILKALLILSSHVMAARRGAARGSVRQQPFTREDSASRRDVGSPSVTPCEIG